MAGEPSSHQYNIQDIVRAVVGNFNSLPPRSSTNPTETSGVTTASSTASTTVVDELNRSFQIPRGAQTFQPRVESQPNSRPIASTNTNDLNRRYQIPRSLQCAQLQPESHPNLQPFSQPTLTDNSLSSGFSARTNYGATSARGTARRRPRSNRCSNTGRFQPYSRSTSQASAEPKVYYKAVCLLPSPTWNTVPRGTVKVDLIEKNLCVDAWAVDKSWTKEDLTSEAAKLFPKVLGSENPEPVPFEFVRSVGTSIVPITLRQGQDLDSKVLRHVTGSGSVYIRALRNLDEDEECDTLEGQDGPLPAAKSDIRSFVMPTCTTEITPSTTGTNICSQVEERQQLEKMFPMLSPEAIKNAIEKSVNVHEAVDILLDNTIEEKDNDESLPVCTFLHPPATRTTFSMSEHLDSIDDDDITVLESYPLSISAMDPSTALIAHKASVFDSSGVQELHINRNSDSIIRDLFKKLKRKEIEAKKTPDVNFIGEEGIDAVGLTKEFFSIVMNSLKCGTGGYVLFEGSDDHLLPVISEEYHQSGYYKYVGLLIAMSVLHAGFGMTGMSRALSVFLATDDVFKAMCHLSISDVPDYGIQEILCELQGLDDPQKLLSFSARDDISMLLYHAGFANESLTPQTKEKAIQCVLLHQVFRSRREQIDDLKRGLQEGLLLNLLKANLSCVQIVFPLTSEHIIKADEFLRLIQSDSDLTEKQAQVLAWFREYVQKLEKGDDDGNESDITLRSLPKLEELVQFTCGSPHLPTNGKRIHVQFTMGDFPDPDACFSILKLPLNHPTLNEFVKKMNIAINCQHKGFGRG